MVGKMGLKNGNFKLDCGMLPRIQKAALPRPVCAAAHRKRKGGPSAACSAMSIPLSSERVRQLQLGNRLV
ncbi:MAG: hypothetical protein ACRCXM_07475, partial [Beijerinckiaceae bacterium]